MNTKFARRSRAVMVISGMVLAGYGSAAGSASASVPVSAVSTKTALVPSHATAPECRPPSLAHCYTQATMRAYVDQVIPLVTQFFRAKYPAMPEPTHYYIAEGQQMKTGCLDRNGKPGIADSVAYKYCPANHNIYLGQAALWHYYNDDGDAAPVVGLAHEWGHHVQDWMGIPEGTTNDASINHENQADCVAGAWIQYANRQKWIEAEDARSVIKFIWEIQSAEGDPNRDHGTVIERGKSMIMGFTGGLSACNSFYPATPVYPSSGGS
ncbi:MAG TPA: neutral zinc metallopeptidase [Pseudonocardiaceae bacterium]|nr:neutral zinc metallopeptidase [Pseudonocardiaceae bacterium]